MGSLRIVFVTGLSGAGLSQAIKSFEDLGFYCIEHLPPAVLEAAIAALERSTVQDVAIALDPATSELYRDTEQSPGPGEGVRERRRCIGHQRTNAQAEREHQCLRAVVGDAIAAIAASARRRADQPIALFDAEKLKVKPGNLFAWFYTTGKKVAGVIKVGEAKYAWKAGAK